MHSLSEKYSHLHTISKTRNCKVDIVQSRDNSTRHLVKSIVIHGNSGSAIDLKRRFCREMEIVSSLDHVNIVKPDETHIDGDTFYIVYPYENGQTLAAQIEEKTVFPEQETLLIAKQLLSALEYIHGRGIIHADVNPLNVFITEEKKTLLLDFGFSMSIEEARNLPEGRIIGTFPYLAPEQMGFTDFKVDTRTDLYCLLVIVYRMLAGKLPFVLQQQTMKELLNSTLKREIFGIPHIPQRLNEVLIRGLRPSPPDRYQTAEGLLWDVNSLLEMLRGSSTGEFCAGAKDVVSVVCKKRLFVEREDELEVLRKALNQLHKGKPVACLLYGKSGIGKTEIVKEFRVSSPIDSAEFISVKCNRFFPTQPYSVIRQLIIEYCAQKIHASTDEIGRIRDVLQNDLGAYSGLLCAIIPELRGWFGQVNEVAVIERDREADRILHVLTMLVASLSAIRRTIWFIDDFQWIDKITFSVVERILGEKVPCMLLCSFRTAESSDVLCCFGKDLSKVPFTGRIRVTEFKRETIAAVVAKRFGTIGGTGDLIDILYRTTEGIPFVLNEAMKYLVKSGALVYRDRQWYGDSSKMSALPEKFDPLSLVLKKLEELSEEEKDILSLLSIVEGRFDVGLMAAMSGKSVDEVTVLAKKYEQFGFITTDFADRYVFEHDRIQESIASGVSEATRYALYEKLAEYYLGKVAENGENIFKAAECYLKSKNLARAIETSYRAAFYATERVAFDVAIRYFKNVLFIADIVPSDKIDPAIDCVKATITFGNVLMMTAAHEQALRIYHRLLEREGLDRHTKLEVVYKIGCCHHSTGAFEKSVPYFIDALRSLGIRVPEKSSAIVIRLIGEVLWMALHPRWFPRWAKLYGGEERMLTLRILNKLSYSLYFTHMIAAMYLQFVANRLATCTVDSYEKAESFAMHGIASYQLTRKGRAFWAVGKAMHIARVTGRSDVMAFSRSFSGMCHYYNAHWRKSENDLVDSIHLYNSIGDNNNQIISTEHLWKIQLMRGNLDDALRDMKVTIDICSKVEEQYFMVVTCAALNHVMYLKTGVVNKERLDDITKRLEKVDSALFHLEAGGYLLQSEIIRGEYQAAYDRAHLLLPVILKKCINSEYQVRIYSLLCQLISIELRYRSRGIRMIDASDQKLRRQFWIYSLVHFVSSINFPAYRGAFLRNIAWFAALHKWRRVASALFKRSITTYHRLDMRYEEACSLQEYGEFLLEYMNRPGDARDQFDRAAVLFNACGAKMQYEQCRSKTGDYGAEHMENPAIHDTRQGDLTREHTSSGVNLVRFETLAEVSKSITETDEPAILLRQILSAMITVTGAQYGCFFINRTTYGAYEPFALTFEGLEVPVASVPVFSELINKVNELDAIEYTGDKSLLYGDNDTETTAVRSDLCVPLNWRDKYLGYVYLVNERVKGLFGEGAQKSAMILAAHAGILLENMQLMGRQKKFNEHLQQQVQKQTEDIRNKTTQLEDANLRLLESERMKGILSGTLVHDIKNYAAGISGNLVYLTRRMENDPKSQRICEVVNETCSDIASLASNLLDIAKMDDGKMVVRLEHIDGSFFEAMCQKFGQSTLFEEKDIFPVVLPPKQEVSLYADVYLLERVLQNLFSNAAKYAPRGSRVEIQFLHEGDEDIVCFFNSGTPIPQSEKEVLFEKYARLKTHKSQYSKGLGLFFCRMVLISHQGRIWLDTDEQGNYFKMAFPSRSNIIPFAAA